MAGKNIFAFANRGNFSCDCELGTPFVAASVKKPRRTLAGHKFAKDRNIKDFLNFFFTAERFGLVEEKVPTTVDGKVALWGLQKSGH